MTRNSPLCSTPAMLLLALLVCLPMSAAERTTLPNAVTATGSVTGRVQNVVTGQYLNNARVAVRGTDLQAFTDESGTYQLTRIPPGPVVLEVFYTGLDPQQITLEVPP